MPERQRQSAAYLSSSRIGRRRELFRTAELNAAGWAALTGFCVSGAAAGLTISRFTGIPNWITMPVGGFTAFAVVLAADRSKWANMHTTYTWTDNLAEVERIATVLQRVGVSVLVVVNGTDWPSLDYRNGDRRHVDRAFRDAGLPPPS
ncbi:hypothetical protein [Actinoplanes sp. NPDC023714]|uniref:hypothetical protein n=1 Tax=Actinoplanes sp. NPDC023714 TaxID=3154322 RepID=UPI0033D5904D